MTTTTWETTREIEVIGLGLDEWTVRNWERYGTVWVRIGEVEYEVSVAIGVPPSLRATAEAAEAAGGDTTRADYVDAWYVASSDWARAPSADGPDGVPEDLSYAVLEAIRDARHRLWREYQHERAREGAEA